MENNRELPAGGHALCPALNPLESAMKSTPQPARKTPSKVRGMFGSHLSIAGGLQNALLKARELDMDCVQVFTKNQRQWSSAPLTGEQVALWTEHRRSTRIDIVVSHDSYLINLASPEPTGRKRSIALFREELSRCAALDIPFLVTHPGAHLGAGDEAGLRMIAEALDEVHRSLPGIKTITCLEVTAGQGTSLGWRFEHLQRIIAQVRQPERLAVCLDTAHLLAAGYDLTSATGYRTVLDELDRCLGLKLVRVIHVNDSKTARGSRVDRHEHIGKGKVSLEALRLMVNHPAFARVPKILETPKEDAPDGRPWDAINLAALRAMLKKS
jgi:deoxyribonuclease IV